MTEERKPRHLQPPPPLEIHPPLLNSANPWATDVSDLTNLFNCPHTGAVTTRTTLIQGFSHDPTKHQYAFFDASSHTSTQYQGQNHGLPNASLNSLGYSPYTLEQYLGFIKSISSKYSRGKKCFIISVTGSSEDVVQCYRAIAIASKDCPAPLAMEINLSCPNIPGSPPPAYDGDILLEYLGDLFAEIETTDLPRIPFGLKTPPYTHEAQFQGLIEALLNCAPMDVACPVSFITATNTLGSCMLLEYGSGLSGSTPALPGSGLGGMAGAPLHPLALGNVATIRRKLDAHHEALGHIQIVGTGGVLDHAGCERMRAAGAYAVGVGTGLGLKGVRIFAEITEGA